MFEAGSESDIEDNVFEDEPLTAKRQNSRNSFRRTKYRTQKRSHRKFRSKRGRKFICLVTAVTAAVVVLIVFFLISILYQNANTHDEEEWTKKKTIMLWHRLDWLESSGHSIESKQNGIISCQPYKCRVRSSATPSVVEYFDAIIFDAAAEAHITRDVPLQRSSKQYYVYASRDLLTTNTSRKADLNFYNLTMTYKLDSDIKYSTYKIAERGAIVAPSLQPNWFVPQLKPNYARMRELLGERSKLAAIELNGNCNNSSKAHILLEEIKNYLEVDVYGDCVCNTSCTTLPYEKYKFYLSFENVLCSDYISNNIYAAMERGLIPVVFSGVDYTRFLPPNSYINAEAYNSVRELTEYLIYLDEHDDEYLSYSWWHYRYYVTLLPTPICDLCAWLHKHEDHEDDSIDLNQWLRTDNVCRKESKLLTF